MPTEASAFVERCNPRLIFLVFRPDKEFSVRHPIGKLAHVHAAFCPALAGLAAIIMLLEIFHRISGKTHRVVRAPALGLRDRKSKRLTSVTNEQLVIRLLLEQ